MTNPTHDLALARAERDAWQTTCEELHHQIARLTVEIESHLERIDAADQRTRSLDAALTAERETSRGLVAQVDTWRDTWARVETIVDEAFGPFPVWPVYDTICAMERGIHDGIRAAQELAAIRDLVAPGNPQGTVVDAVRALRAARDAAIARAEKAEADLRKAVDGYERVTLLQAQTADDAARLRARVAELEARPVSRPDYAASGIHTALGVTATEAARAAMAHGIPCPTCGAEEPAEFTAATVDELAVALFTAREPGELFDVSDIDDRDRAGILAVLAKARLHAVTAEGLAEAIYGSTTVDNTIRARQMADSIIAQLAAASRKAG